VGAKSKTYGSSSTNKLELFLIQKPASGLNPVVRRFTDMSQARGLLAVWVTIFRVRWSDLLIAKAAMPEF